MTEVCDVCGEKHTESAFYNGYERFCSFECAFECMIKDGVPPLPPAPPFPVYREVFGTKGVRAETEEEREYNRSVLVYERLCRMYKIMPKGGRRNA